MAMPNRFASLWREAAPQPVGIGNRARGLARDLYLGVAGRLREIEPAPFLRCLYCHYVFDDQVDRFREILESLLGVGRFVDTSTCMRMLGGEEPITGPTFHLSFDDGFRNIRTNAAPVLADLDIPAIAFVPSQIVGADYERTREYCLEVTRYRAVVEMLSWPEARELPDFGIEIGSHTRTHARLSSISDRTEQLTEEISGSKTDLEEKLDRPCRYISWPYGEAGDIDDAAIAVVQEAGYDGCFSAVRGTVQPGVSSRMKVPRHHFEVQWPDSHIRFFLASDERS